MGTKKPDVVRMPPSPVAALTVGEIRAVGWQVRAICASCRIALWIDLDQLGRLAGDDAILWGRSGRCRVWRWGDQERCTGRVTFQARSIGGGTWVALAMTGEVRTAASLRAPADPTANADLTAARAAGLLP